MNQTNISSTKRNITKTETWKKNLFALDSCISANNFHACSTLWVNFNSPWRLLGTNLQKLRRKKKISRFTRQACIQPISILMVDCYHTCQNEFDTFCCKMQSWTKKINFATTLTCKAANVTACDNVTGKVDATTASKHWQNSEWTTALLLLA